eukprot:14890236-Alexandrium_andersonii.AAC.1
MAQGKVCRSTGRLPAAEAPRSEARPLRRGAPEPSRGRILAGEALWAKMLGRQQEGFTSTKRGSAP